MWKAELSEEEVAAIIKECEYYDPQQASIGNSQNKNTKDSDIRRSIIRWIDSSDKNSQFIYDILWKYAQIANREAFGFDINYLQDVQYTIYEATDDGFYDWHFDTFWGSHHMNDRKLSVTIQLSDSRDYKGGDFKIDEQYEPPLKADLRQKGTIFIFPSFLYHMVEPVTEGVRKSLVGWYEGPKFK